MRSGYRNQLSRSSRKQKLSKEAQQALLRAYGLQQTAERYCWLREAAPHCFLMFRHLRHLSTLTIRLIRSFCQRLVR